VPRGFGGFDVWSLGLARQRIMVEQSPHQALFTAPPPPVPSTRALPRRPPTQHGIGSSPAALCPGRALCALLHLGPWRGLLTVTPASTSGAGLTPAEHTRLRGVSPVQTLT
jgi:hypothetical protein